MASQVELRELRTFLLVAEELQFARASERLGLTPSRVSQTIATLEHRIGARLFDRTSRRVTLTQAGERLLAEIAPHVAALDQALDRARRPATAISGQLRLAAFIRPTAGPHIAEIIDTFTERYPAATVTYDHDVAYLDGLRGGRWDLIAARLPLTDADVTIGPVLTRERPMLVVARNHPLATRALITLDDVVDAGLSLPSNPLLPQEMLDAFIPAAAPSGRPIRRHHIPDVDASLVSVAGGRTAHVTVSSFFDYFSNPDLAGVPLDMPVTSTALAWMTARSSPMIEAFASVAAEITARHGRADNVDGVDDHLGDPAERVANARAV